MRRKKQSFQYKENIDIWIYEKKSDEFMRRKKAMIL